MCDINCSHSGKVRMAVPIKPINLLSLFLLLSLLGPGCWSLPDLTWTHSLILDPGEQFTLLWIPEQEDIIFEVRVSSKYMFGFSQ